MYLGFRTALSVMCILVVMYCSFLGGLFLHRRDIHPIKARMPFLAVLQVAGWLVLSMLLFLSTGYPDISHCITTQTFLVFFGYIHFAALTLRVVLFYIAFDLTKTAVSMAKAVKDKKKKVAKDPEMIHKRRKVLIARQKWFLPQYVALGMAVLVLPPTIFFVVYAAVFKADSFNITFADDRCGLAPAQIFFMIIFLVVDYVVSVVLIRRLKLMDEVFGIRQELKNTLWSFIVPNLLVGPLFAVFPEELIDFVPVLGPLVTTVLFAHTSLLIPYISSFSPIQKSRPLKTGLSNMFSFESRAKELTMSPGRTSVIKVERFEVYLTDSEVYEAYKAFLTARHAGENILFWKEAFLFRQRFMYVDPGDVLAREEMRTEGMKIYKQYIPLDALAPINIPSDVKKSLDFMSDETDGWEDVTFEIFDRARRQVLQNMLFGEVFHDFQKTPDFAKFKELHDFVLKFEI